MFKFSSSSKNRLAFVAMYLLLLSTPCFAQTATPSSIGTAGGFLDVCGLKDTQLSKETMDTVKKAPTGEAMETLNKALAQKTAEVNLCLGYLKGLMEGWQEGHEHGVMAAHFPDGVPRDVTNAVKSLPDKEIDAMGAEFKNGVPCLREHISIGGIREIVVNYIRDQVTASPLMGLVPTSRMFPLALLAAFPCPTVKPAVKPSDPPR